MISINTNVRTIQMYGPSEKLTNSTQVTQKQINMVMISQTVEKGKNCFIHYRLNLFI